MFTGLIEKLSVIERIEKRGELSLLAVRADGLLGGGATLAGRREGAHDLPGVKPYRSTFFSQAELGDMKIGDSIAINGACLTIVSFDKETFTVEVMRETQQRTNLGHLKAGDRVNLERALKVGGHLGGHFVTGHIDGVGEIIKKDSQKDDSFLEIEVPFDLMAYIVPKGSIAVDGISLTVANIARNSFTVYLIPHTLKVTTLGFKGLGDTVNIEVDILGKYIYRVISDRQEGEDKITKEFLKEQGFI